MKDVIYIHAGLPKTGTTALQTCLSNNREVLSSLGYYVPVSGLLRNQHYFLSASLRPESESYLEYIHWEMLHEELEKTKEPNLILSSEGFSAVENIKILKDMASALARQVVLIFYFRRQDEWLRSNYKTMVKDFRRFNGPLSVYLQYSDDRHLALCDYLSRIQQWTNVFNARNVKVRPYKYLTRTCGIISDFLDIIGVDQDTKTQFKDTELAVHKSAPDIATDLIARLNNLPSLPSLQWKISREILTIAINQEIGIGKTTASCSFTDEEMTYIRDVLSKNNKELVDKYMEQVGQEFLDFPKDDTSRLPFYEEQARILDQERIIELLHPPLRDHIHAVVRNAGYKHSGEVDLPANELDMLKNAYKRLNTELQWMRLSMNKERVENYMLEQNRHGESD